MKKIIVSLVLALSMLISFGLSTLSISASPRIDDFLLDEYGGVYNTSMSAHVELGTYHNTFATTNQPYTSYFYALTSPNYYDQDFYNSQLKATALFETYYYLEDYLRSASTEVTITDDVYREGNNGSNAQVEGYDYDTAYLQLSQGGRGIFYYRIVNTVYSTATTEFYGAYTEVGMFCFDNNGVSID